MALALRLWSGHQLMFSPWRGHITHMRVCETARHLDLRLWQHPRMHAWSCSAIRGLPCDSAYRWICVPSIVEACRALPAGGWVGTWMPGFCPGSPSSWAHRMHPSAPSSCTPAPFVWGGQVGPWKSSAISEVSPLPGLDQRWQTLLFPGAWAWKEYYALCVGGQCCRMTVIKVEQRGNPVMSLTH